MTPTKAAAQAPEARLTIGDLARETGLTPPVLRTWEARHGFPRATRLASGHRRYPAEQVELVHRVLRRKEAGVRLEVAIAEVLGSAGPPGSSVFAAVRRGHPALTPSRLRKSTLVALSWALEDECCARAERPVLFGAFQRRQYWEDAADRWAELARVARSTTVFADFDTVSATAPGEPTLVPLAADALMRREWVLVCDSPTHPATLAAWELPGQLGVPERDRLFECVWSIDPRVVRTAATVCAALALEAGMDGAAVLVRDLDTEPDQGAIDGPAAMSLFSRVVEYVDRLG